MSRWHFASTLGHGFALMRARLEQARGQLRGKNRELEVRVSERTTPLRVEIGERERAGVAMRERLFRAMFESSVVGIALLDSNGSLLDMNLALRTMLGLSEGGGGVADPGGVDLDLLIHPDDRAGWAGIWRSTPPVLPDGPLDVRWTRPDGGVVWSRVVVSDVVQGADAPHLGMVMVENVTERRALQNPGARARDSACPPYTGLSTRAVGGSGLTAPRGREAPSPSSSLPSRGCPSYRSPTTTGRRNRGTGVSSSWSRTNRRSARWWGGS